MRDAGVAACRERRSGAAARAAARGGVLVGLLTVREACPVCALDLSAQDAGDGPQVFVILFLGLVVVGLAAFVELRFGPPMWVHLLLWTPLILGGTVLLLRPLKAGLIALQYRHGDLRDMP